MRAFDHLLKVIDAETFVGGEASDRVVRLANTDTPELGTPDGDQAKACFKNMILGKAVLVNTVDHNLDSRRVPGVPVNAASVNYQGLLTCSC